MTDKVAGAQPAQDLAGVRTWVEKGNQDGSQKDKSAPEKSRPDYADGKPQRDRVLPLPSGHPKGRDEERAGPPVMNTPSDSSGASTSYSKAMNPNAIPNQPQGKPLHQRPRSSGVPGDEYGHPFIDQSTSTGLKRRVASDEIIEELEDGYYDLDDEGHLIVAEISVLPPRRRQRKQKGDLEHKHRRRRQRAYRRNRGKRKAERKRYYRRNKNRIKRYMKRYRKSPQLFKRLEGGGVSTNRQRNQKSRKASLAERVANLFILGAEELEVTSDELLAIPSKGPGSRSRPQQQKQRRRNKMRGDRNRLRRERAKYYRRNKAKEKRRSKMWRKKYRSKLKTMRRRASGNPDSRMSVAMMSMFPNFLNYLLDRDSLGEAKKLLLILDGFMDGADFYLSKSSPIEEDVEISYSDRPTDRNGYEETRGHSDFPVGVKGVYVLSIDSRSLLRALTRAFGKEAASILLGDMKELNRKGRYERDFTVAFMEKYMAKLKRDGDLEVYLDTDRFFDDAVLGESEELDTSVASHVYSIENGGVFFNRKGLNFLVRIDSQYTDLGINEERTYAQFHKRRFSY